MASGAGTSSSGDDARSSVGFRVDMSLGQLLGFFDAQIEEQDWKLDSDWSGNVSTGSVWILGKQEERVVGILTILKGQDNFYEVGFSAKRLTQ